ncbi:MAG: hypothetical protein ABWW65_04730 [Thermoprotei archaeon]
MTRYFVGKNKYPWTRHLLYEYIIKGDRMLWLEEEWEEWEEEEWEEEEWEEEEW